MEFIILFLKIIGLVIGGPIVLTMILWGVVVFVTYLDSVERCQKKNKRYIINCKIKALKRDLKKV